MNTEGQDTKSMDSRIVAAIMSPCLDHGRHYRAKIGYVLLATEQTVQDDVMRLCPEGVGVHFARAPIPDSITNATLAAQVDHLAPCAASFLPDGSLDVVCYACTSGSLIIGEERVHEELNKGAPKAKATSLIRSVIKAIETIGAKKIVVITPYLDEINQRELDYLEKAEIEVLAISGLNLEKDSDMVRVPPEFIVDFALSLDYTQADAIFISCGALRALDVVDEIEKRAGIPVISSNQAMIWDTFRLAKIDDQLEGFGELFCKY
jgi:maleate isomerase